MSRGDHHVHLGFHQLRSNREKGRVAWMYGNYYCVRAMFVEKIDDIQKKSVSLWMGMIRINRQIWQSWRRRRHGPFALSHCDEIQTQCRQEGNRWGFHRTSFVNVRIRKACRNGCLTFSNLWVAAMNFSLWGGTKIDQFTRAAHLPGRNKII